VETRHSVTQDSVILVKNVTFVMTELMAPAARAEMVSPPKKMAHVKPMMEEMNNYACRTAIAVEIHHSVTQGSVIHVKNVTFVMTELMALAANAGMVSLPKKMAHVTLMMKEMNNGACRTAIAVETHHFVSSINVIPVKNVTFVTMELMAPAALVEMDSPPMKMALVINQAIPVVLVRAL